MRQRNTGHAKNGEAAKESEAQAHRPSAQGPQRKAEKGNPEKKVAASRGGGGGGDRGQRPTLASVIFEKIIWALLFILFLFALLLLTFIGCSAIMSASPQKFYGPEADGSVVLRSVRLVKETGDDLIDAVTESSRDLWYQWKQSTTRVAPPAINANPIREEEFDAAAVGRGGAAAGGPPPTLSANYERMEQKKAAAAEAPPATKTTTTSESDAAKEKKAAAETREEKAEASSAPHKGIRCYTLEQFSDLFIADEIKHNVLLSSKYALLQQQAAAAAAAAGKSASSTAPHFFRCGTRISDLRHLELQFDTTAQQKGKKGGEEDKRNQVNTELVRYLREQGCQDGSATPSQFPQYRVILTRKDIQLHEKQKDNAAFQLVPLRHFNDDYCDCYDGSDEVATNACSMASGSGMILAGRRWAQYHSTVPDIPIYEEVHLTNRSDSVARNHILLEAEKKVRGWHAGGYVVPFACGQNRASSSSSSSSSSSLSSSENLVAAAEATVLLAPSKLGDGIVDCPDGSDEDVSVYTQYYTPRALSSSSSSSSSNGKQEAEAKAAASLRDLQQKTVTRWKEQKDSLQAHLATQEMSYSDPVFPFTSTPTALLIEKGFLALFAPATIARERLRYYQQMREVLREGYGQAQERKQKGYEAYGAELRKNHTAMEKEILNYSNIIHRRQEVIINRMRAKGAKTPQEIGVPNSEIEQINAMIRAYDRAAQHFQMIDVFIEDQLAGKHYEFYPLFEKLLSIPWSAVLDGTYGASRTGNMSITDMRDGIENKTIHYPELHFSNFSLSAVGLQAMSNILAAQAYTEAEAPFVLRQLGIIEDERNYTPAMLEALTDVFTRSPIIQLGTLQPFLNKPNTAPMQMLDAAGDVLLTRRLLGRPSSWLHRGGGELWGPARHVRERVTWHAVPPDPKKKTKERAEEKEEVLERVHSFMHHTPQMSVTHSFISGVRCEEVVAGGLHDTPQQAAERALWGKKEWAAYSEKHTARGHVVYVCDSEDRVLRMGLNGGCQYEIVVGTPSACAGWMLRTAEEAIRVLEEQQHEQQN